MLINIHSYRNAGDAALTEVALGQLRKHFPGCQITVMMNDPQSFTGEAKTVISFLRWGTRNPHNQSLKFFWLAIVSVISILSYHLFRHPFFLPITSDVKDSIGAYLNADLVICTPGGYFYRYGRGRALIVFMLTIAFAILAKKPLYMLPQSFGPSHPRGRDGSRNIYSSVHG